ncbi:MAG: hypothetical protein AB7E49_06405 [Campylobacterales bacterium]
MGDRILETKTAKGNLREIDNAYAGFASALEAEFDKMGIGKMAVAEVLIASGFYEEDFKIISSELGQSLPLDRNKERNAATKDVSLANASIDPVPYLDLTEFGMIQTRYGGYAATLDNSLVTSQAGLTERMQHYFEPFSALATNPKRVEAAYDRYVADYNAWALRNNAETINREAFDAEIQTRMKHWTEKRDIYGAALEVAKSFDFFTKHEFTA